MVVVDGGGGGEMEWKWVVGCGDNWMMMKRIALDGHGAVAAL